MKKTLILTAWVVICALTAPAQLVRPIDSLAASMRRHLDILASDSLLGRNTPSAGLESAANYIISQFQAMGIEPAGGAYRHTIGLHRKKLGTQNSFTAIVNNQHFTFELKRDFIPFGFSADTTTEAPVVFAGYGITDTATGYDDYANLDVAGKIVVVLSDGPKNHEALSTEKLTRERNKATNAIARGAVGFIMVNSPAHRMILSPRGYPWPSLSRTIPESAMPVEIAFREEQQVAAVHAGESVIKALWGSADALKNLQQKLETGMKPAEMPLSGVVMKIRCHIENEQLQADNIAGIITGSDSSLRKEVLVIGAHYDHVGAGKDKGDGADFIYNGADDNASGTSGVLAIADLFSRQQKPPLRSVLFILFAGEERGLLGSQAYVNTPLMPIENTVAMINFDMISRNGDSLFLEGGAACPELTTIVKTKNEQLALNLITDNNALTGGSDHASFAEQGVPFLFFITGLHKDYHQVTDNPDKADAMKAAKVAGLGFLTAWQIANESNYYSLKK